jgi:hypothetical protein
VSLKTYDYECDCGVAELIVEYDERDQQICETCGKGDRLMSAPPIHTLETHMRGYRNDTNSGRMGEQGHYNPSDKFVDENLTDARGNPLSYSTLAEKKRLLKENGLYERTDPKPKRRSQRPMFFTGGSNRRDQLG